MKLPDGYLLERTLTLGPVSLVALARRPDGTPCVVKCAATARALSLVESEVAVLRALAAAGTEGAPRLLDAWPGGMAVAVVPAPTLRSHERAMRGDPVFRVAAARAAFGALAAVHDARDSGGPLEVVHGDLSPDNVFVADGGAPAWIADFGLARWRGAAGPNDGAFRGTLRYAAPEVARGELPDGRADDFSLAASLLDVATGIPLHAAAGAGAAPAVMLVDAGTRALDASHPWRQLAPKLFDRAVSEALLACLAFDPGDRPRATPRPC